MRSDRIAQTIVSLVTPADRAAAAIGDLIELVPARGRLWFWAAILRTTLATVLRHLVASPVVLAFYAAIALIGYGLVWLLLWLAAGPLLVTLGVILDLVGLSSPTLSEPDAAVLGTLLALVTFAAAPYLSGLRIAQLWGERAVALTMALLGWLVVLAILPMVAPSERIPHLPMPSLFSIVPFMMAGVVSQRLNTLRKSVRA